MIDPRRVIDSALDAASVDETIVLVSEHSDASLRWANDTMTTNGVSTSRSTAVISIVRDSDSTRVGSVETSEVDPDVIGALVAASEEAARNAPAARDAAPLIGDSEESGSSGGSGGSARGSGGSGGSARGSGGSGGSARGSGSPEDWDAAVVGTGAKVFGAVAEALARGFKGPETLFGYAHHASVTTFVANSLGLRRRFTQPSGSVEINAKRDGASSWAGVGTPDFVDVPVEGLLEQLAVRLGWSERTVALPAGRYPTLMPPSTVADMMIYMTWMMDGRGAQEGRTTFSAPGGGTRVGERLTQLPVTLYSDPFAKPLSCRPFVATSSSSDVVSVFDNGMDIGRVDWIRDGVLNALAYPRAAASEFGVDAAVPAGNLLMTGGDASLDEMIASSERALLLTTLWYIRTVDPTSLLLTGLTRDGVYLVEDGEVRAAVNNFRFNESPLSLLRRAIEVGASEITLPREWGDYATRAAMPTLRIPDFYMSSVSQAQ
ncbi:MAG: TldD/PmbA family protein [Mycobacteriaceae bacterium]|nr:TldD/PmbA family protein [Mycobacteriaceae bacterium]